MTIYITGSTGFLGNNLVGHLGFTRPSESVVRVRRTGESNSYSHVHELVGATHGALVHLAGKAHDLGRESDEAEYFRANFDLTRQVFDQFMSSSLETFVFVSSIKAVSERSSRPVDETAVACPGTPYGESKLRAEEYIRSVESTGKRVYILRLCMTHGPENKGNLNLLKAFVNAGIPNPLGAFENSRSILGVDNLLYVLDRLLFSKVEPGLYHVADDDPLSTNEMIEIIADALGRRSMTISVPRGVIRASAKIGDLLRLPINTGRLAKLTENFVVNNGKLKTALGIQEMPVLVGDGLRRTIGTHRPGFSPRD